MRIILFFLLIGHTLVGLDKKIPMYALYTPSHTVLVKQFFLPSLHDPNIELFLKKIEIQSCVSANFMDIGWTKTTIKKIELILEAIETHWGNIFILSDVDIQFFGPIAGTLFDLMKGYDFLIQKDNPKGTLCSGFFVCRANQKTKQLFSDVLQLMKSHPEISDQRALNRCLSRNQKKQNKYRIKWDYLPTELFFGGGTFTGVYWNGKNTLPIPRSPLMHHANWVKGIKGKLKQLQHVRDKIQKINNVNSKSRFPLFFWPHNF
jgi:hypothetical protein